MGGGVAPDNGGDHVSGTVANAATRALEFETVATTDLPPNQSIAPARMKRERLGSLSHNSVRRFDLHFGSNASSCSLRKRCTCNQHEYKHFFVKHKSLLQNRFSVCSTVTHGTVRAALKKMRPCALRQIASVSIGRFNVPDQHSFRISSLLSPYFMPCLAPKKNSLSLSTLVELEICL